MKGLLHDRLGLDHVDLATHPYTTQEGKQGVLDGLASRYADQFNTHYQDVFDHLEHLRRDAWSALINRHKPYGVITPANEQNKQQQQKLVSEAYHKLTHHTHMVEHHQQETESSSQASSSSLSPEHHGGDPPIYVPGRYNPSSCLSDAEEDEIYGYARTGRPPPPPPLLGCLNPRSQYIYELPPVAGKYL